LPLHGVTILLVEDDRDSREITESILTTLGATVVAVENGADALEKLATPPMPDLILCDLMMPIMSGYIFARRLRADPRYRRVPLVALTAIRDERAQLRTMMDGFDAHLEKPVTWELMDSLVRFLPQRSPPPAAPSGERQRRADRRRPAA
jgi:CheY-like chemotaxis protein